MANFDLISEDDFFSGEEKKKPDQEMPEKSQPDEDLFARPLPDIEETVFEQNDMPDEPLDLDDIAEQQSAPQDFSEDVKENFDFSTSDTDAVQPEFPEKPAAVSEPQQEPEPELSKEKGEELPDYYDDKQKQISYKPFIIGALIVVITGALIYFAKSFLFNSSETAPVEKQKTEQAASEAKGPSQEEIRKTNFYKDLAGKTKNTTSNIISISGAVLQKARLSSVLFYGSDLIFEAFAKTRAGLAKLNIKLKEEFKNNKINIVSSQDRPGTNGGVFGIYKMILAGGGGSAASTVSNPFKSASEAKDWLSFLVENGSLKMKAFKTRSLGRRSGFDAVELDASVFGSRDNCLQLIKSIGDANRNIMVSKLSLNAVDQRSFNSKKYQMRLILQIFM